VSSFPGSQSLARGRSYFSLVAGTSPGAGNNFTYVVAGEYVQTPLSVHVRVTADATVATRQPKLVFTDQGGTEFAAVASSVGVTASQAKTYQFAAAFGGILTGVDAAVTTGLPLPQIPLLPGFQLQFLIGNIQAGDTITAIFLYIERAHLDYGAAGDV